MKRFECACGRRIFFDNATCLGCGRALGFLPETLAMSALDAVCDNRYETSTGAPVKRCRNALDYGNCNWVLSWDDPHTLCLSCRANLTIPTLEKSDNVLLWTKMERAKRRLLYALLDLGLLTASGPDEARPSFRFLEDQRRNPNVREEFVATGHGEGVITLNLSEADDISRQTQRQRLVERYRTVLGHLRHEAGHFFFARLTREPADLEACRRVFGDESHGYDEALSDHYAVGPARDWADRHVSAYASVHPREDFAESFAHYLLIVDTLDTANAVGMKSIGAGLPWIDRWIEVAIALNEVSRSLGSDDAYPFTLTPPVIEKLHFIAHLVRRHTT